MAGKESVRRKVLIVEDAKTTRDALTLLLTNQGFETIQAADGREVLETTRTLRPDLIILDSELPGMSGYEVYAQLIRDPEVRRTPVVFLVADTDSFDIPTRSVPPAQFLVSKPFKAQALLERVARALANSGGNRPAPS